MGEIEKINLELKELYEQVLLKKKQLIKAKLKYTRENGISEHTKLTEKEIELLNTYIMNKGNPKSAMIQREWKYASIPDEVGFEYDMIDIYLMLGFKIYSVTDNAFIDRNAIEKDFNRESHYYGRKTLFGSKRQLIQPLSIDNLFVEEKDEIIENVYNR